MQWMMPAAGARGTGSACDASHPLRVALHPARRAVVALAAQRGLGDLRRPDAEVVDHLGGDAARVGGELLVDDRQRLDAGGGGPTAPGGVVVGEVGGGVSDR